MAGKRAGLKHEANGDEETTRSGLFMEAVRIIKEMREATHGKYPRFILWENVPGAFSSNKGEDFRIVLEEIIKIIEPQAVMPEVPKNGWPYADCYRGHGWSLSYRVLDSQYIRTAQRRRRLYLIGDFRSERAGEVLFKREGLRGDLAPCRAPRQGATTDAEDSVGTEGSEGKTFGLTTKGNGDAFISEERHTALSTGGGQAGQGYPAILEPTCKGKSLIGQRSASESDVAATICASYGTKWNGNSGAYSGENFVIGIDGYNGNVTGNKSATLGVNCGTSTGRNGVIEQQVQQAAVKVLTPWDSQGNQVVDGTGQHKYGTLRGCGGAGYQAGYVLTEAEPKTICMATQQGGAEIRTDDKAPTVTAAAGMSGNNQPVVCMPIAFAQNQRDEIRDLGDKAGALQAQLGMKQQTFIIDSIGGQAESAKETDVAPTLKACHYKFPPSIAVSAGFCTEHSAKARGVGFEEETSPKLRAGVTPAVVYDARGNGAGDKVATITGGHESSISDYTNVVVESVVYNGANITSPVNAANPQPGDPCHTLSTDSRNYCVAPQVKLASGKEVSGTLMASGYDKLGGQEMFSGDYTVIEEQPVYCLQGNGIDRADTAGCNGKGWKEDSSYTLNTVDRPAVAYGEPAKTNYIVRRLTPTECARLQGFADFWGHPDKKEDFTEEEYSFWHEVRNTHAAINSKLVKDYTKAQMLNWYNKLHTDSAEYKMWGNGIALPTALYCMEGIAEALNEGK